jgi:hypothetical protein
MFLKRVYRLVFAEKTRQKKARGQMSNLRDGGGDGSRPSQGEQKRRRMEVGRFAVRMTFLTDTGHRRERREYS